LTSVETPVDDERVEWFAERFDDIASNVETVIQGKREVIDLVLSALFAEGHVLIEDVPGVGKTLLAKSIARSIDCTFHRIQFTPDLLPSDVTGVSVWDRQASEFVFKPGAIFANIVVGDEINRASPKTQAALLEAMEERQVTSDGSPASWAPRSWSSPPRTRSSTKAPIPCRKPNSTGSRCGCGSDIRPARRNWR
jgi:MoxR-like ATPase